MKVWVLFVWLSSSLPMADSYESKAECQRVAGAYKNAVCIEVYVPRRPTP